MTLPFVLDLLKFWEEHPPLHVMVEAFMTAKGGKKKPGKGRPGEVVEERVTPEGKVTLTEFANLVGKYDGERLRRVKFNG